MSVNIRQAGNEWLIEFKGEPIGKASTEAEAQELADYWIAKLKWVATWRFTSQGAAKETAADESSPQ